MRTLITGGAGFAGSHLAEQMVERGQEVIILAREDESLVHVRRILTQVRVERRDLRDEEGLFQILQQTRPQRIYHLAALTSPAESVRQPELTYEINFRGTLNLLNAWFKLEFDCRLLLVSSAEVYGVEFAGPMPLREEAPFRPANPYAASKAAAELLGFQYYTSYGLPIVRVRPFNHTGPRQSADFVCSSLARQIAEIEAGLRPPCISVGDLEVSRDFSDVRDIVRGYHLVLEKGKPGDVYQLCSGRAVPVKTILDFLRGCASQPVEIKVDETRVRAHQAPVLWGDPSKAQEALGWKQQYPLEVTLQDLVQYWKEAIRVPAEAT